MLFAFRRMCIILTSKKVSKIGSFFSLYSTLDFERTCPISHGLRIKYFSNVCFTKYFSDSN